MTSKKTTLRRYTRERPSAEDRNRFRDNPFSFDPRGDLVVAIVLAIEIEYLLEEAIIGKLARADEKTLELLTKESCPLSTFYSKIVLAYAMNIIDEPTMENLNIIRRIRNAFAHSRRNISFTTDQVKDEFRAIRLPNDKGSQLYKGLTFVTKVVTLAGTKRKLNGIWYGPRSPYIFLTTALRNYLG
jgi:hypothetical protein